ncbi:MAG: hypothetical protein JW888_12730 [Pirellulales bacterium]|nr:hypothetical protein [Pirellulales bacterium]
MGSVVLHNLLSEEFGVATSCFGTPLALYHFLHTRPEVHAIQESFRQGALTEGTIRRFVVELLQDLHSGIRFPHELAICALAVALESRATDFAEEFLLDLARLRTAEMSLSIRVARECLKRRMELPRTKGKVFRLGKVSNGNLVKFFGGRSVGSTISFPVSSESTLAIAR